MPHPGLQLPGGSSSAHLHSQMSTEKGNLPFEQELFETDLCYKGLILRAAWENWASADLLQVPEKVVPMMTTLSLMYPESLSTSVDETVRSQYGVLPAF